MMIAGLVFAFGVGLSTWVTLVFFVFWGFWMIITYLGVKNREYLLPMGFAGLVSLVFALPFLSGYYHDGGSTGGGFPISIEPCAFFIVDALLGDSPTWVIYLFRLLLLPVNYFF